MKPPKIPSQCKNKDDCRLHYGAATTTCVAWLPIYDGHGNLLNQDPNIFIQAVACDACKGEWIERRERGAVTWELIPSR